MTNYEKILYIKGALERPLLSQGNEISLLECDKAIRYLKDVSKYYRIKKVAIKGGK